MRIVSHAVAPLVLAGALGLGACADQPDRAMVARPAPGGTWIVTDAFPAGPVRDAASAPRGQRVRLESDMAGDVAGRACPWPTYRDVMAPLGSVTGSDSAAGMGETVRVLEVDCAGQPYSRYAAMADGTLLTRHGPWLLRLEAAERLAASPAPMEAEAPRMAMPASSEPAKPESAPPAVAPPAPPAMAAKTLVYLASYKTEAWARKGWSILAADSATLKGLEPVMRRVEIKGKGTFVRLFAGAGDAAQAKMVCKELGKAIAECGAAGREK